MITDADVEKLKHTFATKDDLSALAATFATKAELKDFRNDFNIFRSQVAYEFAQQAQNSAALMGKYRDDVLTKIDSYMKRNEDYKQEHIMLDHQVNRHEKWIHRIADDTHTALPLE